MGLRYIKDLMLEKAVLHVIDVEYEDEAILASKELTINEVVEEFVRKSVMKPLNSDDTYSARFLGDNVPVAQLINHVINNNDDFLKVSKHLAIQMYESTKNSDIQPCDLLVAQYIADEQRCFAVIRLEHQVSQSHNIEFENDSDEPHVDLITNEGILPKAGMGYKKCAFFTRGVENTIEMIVVDKTQKLEDGNEAYFMDDFLEAVKISDDTSKTRDFKATVEKWTQKNLADQIEMANTVREVCNDMLINEEIINIDDMTEELFSDEESASIKESFKEHMSDCGYRAESEFEVDKTWVEKKFKSKIIKTDTGVVIKAEFDFFRDAQRYVEKDNGDGTLDIIIKNVRNVKEKKGNQ